MSLPGKAWKMGERPKSHPHKNWDCEMTVTGEIKRKWGREAGEVLESHLQNRITGSESVAVFKVIFVISLSRSPHNESKGNHKSPNVFIETILLL